MTQIKNTDIYNLYILCIFRDLESLTRRRSFKGSWVQFSAVRLQTCCHCRFRALNVTLGIQALLPRRTAMLLVVHVLPWTVALECERKNEFCLETSTRLTPPIWRWRHFYNLRNPSLNRHQQNRCGSASAWFDDTVQVLYTQTPRCEAQLNDDCETDEVWFYACSSNGS